MLVNRVRLLHRVGIFIPARFDFQFCIACLGDRHEPIDAGLAVGFDFNARLFALHRLAVNDQPPTVSPSAVSDGPTSIG